MLILVVIGVIMWREGVFNNRGDGSETTVVKNTETGVEEALGAENTTVEGVSDEAIEKSEETEVVQYEGGNPNALGELTGVVTYAGVRDGTLTVRVNIDQYLESGSCELALVSGGMTIYSEGAEIIGSATTASCTGFDVPVAGLPRGQLSIVVWLESGDKKGGIRGEVEI